MKDNITCKQAVNYISQKEEGELSGWKRLQLWKHLASCSLCRIFHTQNKLITKALSGYQSKPPVLTEEDKAALLQKVLNKKDG